jgi:hypothetical protein
MQAHQREPIFQPHPNVPRTNPLEFTTILQDDKGPAHADQAVLLDTVQGDMWFARAHEERPLDLDVDFATESIIAVASGASDVPGQRIEIVRVDVTVGGFVGVQYGVHYRVVAPAAARAAEQATLYPQHLVKVPKLLKRVVSFYRVDASE